MRKSIADYTVKVLASKPMCSVMEVIRRQCVPTFMLHRMADEKVGVKGHPTSALESAFQYLKENHYTVISARELVNSITTGKSLPPRSVVFTMDDGFYDQAEFALPLFEKYQFPVTVFLATNMLDHGDWSWDFKLEYLINQAKQEKLLFEFEDISKSYPLTSCSEKSSAKREIRAFLKKQPNDVVQTVLALLADYVSVEIPKKAPAEYKSMSWEQVKSLESEYVEFGAHTCSHLILSRLSDEDAKNEILGSWNRLVEEVERPSPVFCYPTGRAGIDFGEREKELVRSIGFDAAYSADPGYVEVNKRSADDLYSLRRFSFTNSLTDFIQYCSWVERAKQLITLRV